MVRHVRTVILFSMFVLSVCCSCVPSPKDAYSRLTSIEPSAIAKGPHETLAKGGRDLIIGRAIHGELASSDPVVEVPVADFSDLDSLTRRAFGMDMRDVDPEHLKKELERAVSGTRPVSSYYDLFKISTSELDSARAYRITVRTKISRTSSLRYTAIDPIVYLLDASGRIMNKGAAQLDHNFFRTEELPVVALDVVFRSRDEYFVLVCADNSRPGSWIGKKSGRVGASTSPGRYDPGIEIDEEVTSSPVGRYRITVEVDKE